MKYYTPTAEDFHIGFQYEINMHYRMAEEPLWYQTRITEDNWHLNMDIINVPDRARVKYLDKEDIESLGWKKRLGTSVEIYYLHWPEKEGNHTGIWLEKKGNMYTIVNAMTKIHFMQYWGYIKNISELKKLMQQLNIA